MTQSVEAQTATPPAAKRSYPGAAVSFMNKHPGLASTVVDIFRKESKKKVQRWDPEVF